MEHAEVIDPTESWKNCMLGKLHAFNIRDKGVHKNTTPSFRGFNLND